MNKLIANGIVKDADNVLIIASVYVKLNEDGTESTTAGDKFVTFLYKEINAAALPTDVISFASIVGEGETALVLKVPGFNGHAEVTLAAPTVVRYSKTKAFTNFSGKNQVSAAIRYNF